MIKTTSLTGSQEPEIDRWIYFAPSEIKEMSPEHQDQFYFLDKPSTDHVYEVVNSIDLLCGDDGWGNTPFSNNCYKSVERFEYKGDENESMLKKWLYNRGLPFKSEVLILPVFGAENDPAILSTWKMVMKYADTFFSSDNVIILNPAATWCLYFHHDGMLSFAEGRRY